MDPDRSRAPAPRPSAPRLTIEELLQLKRLERPEPVFWSRFDDAWRRREIEAVVAPELHVDRTGAGVLVYRWAVALGSLAAAGLIGLGLWQARALVDDPALGPLVTVASPAAVPDDLPVPSHGLPLGAARFVVDEIGRAAADRAFVLVAAPETYRSLPGPSAYPVDTLTSLSRDGSL